MVSIPGVSAGQGEGIPSKKRGGGGGGGCLRTEIKNETENECKKKRKIKSKIDDQSNMKV